MFSKRHYEYLANWIGSATICSADPMARNLFASSLADRLERDNPRFDRKRFLAAARGNANVTAMRQVMAEAAD